MDWLEVSIGSGRIVFSPGEEVEATAVWRLDDVPRSLELRLFWFTEGKGDRDSEIAARAAIEPAASGHQTCRLRIPELGPCSFSGRLISLLWAVELVAEPGDHAGRAGLVVSSLGREILLYPEAPEGPEGPEGPNAPGGGHASPG